MPRPKTPADFDPTPDPVCTGCTDCTDRDTCDPVIDSDLAFEAASEDDAAVA